MRVRRRESLVDNVQLFAPGAATLHNCKYRRLHAAANPFLDLRLSDDGPEGPARNDGEHAKGLLPGFRNLSASIGCRAIRLFVLIVVARAAPRGPEGVAIHVGAHLTSLLGTTLLVEAEVNAAVDTGIVDVGRDVSEPRVLENHIRDGWGRDDDGMTSPAEDALEHLTSGVA